MFWCGVGGLPASLRGALTWILSGQGQSLLALVLNGSNCLKIFHYIELKSVPCNLYPQILVLLSGKTQTQYIQLTAFLLMEASSFWNNHSHTLQLFSIGHYFQTSDCYS